MTPDAAPTWAASTAPITAVVNGATLTVDALDPDKAKTTGTIEVVKEGTAWKLGKESWKSQ